MICDLLISDNSIRNFNFWNKQINPKKVNVKIIKMEIS